MVNEFPEGQNQVRPFFIRLDGSSETAFAPWHTSNMVIASWSRATEMSLSPSLGKSFASIKRALRNSQTYSFAEVSRATTPLIYCSVMVKTCAIYLSRIGSKSCMAWSQRMVNDCPVITLRAWVRNCSILSACATSKV
jgi:hypothetical protein